MAENIPYEEWTFVELQDELRARDLPVSGTKAALADRLTQDDVAREDRPPSEPPDSGDQADDRATTAAAADPDEAAEDDEDARKAGECVVDDGTAHTGRAVNGMVCSAHAMHYKADGTRRAEVTRR